MSPVFNFSKLLLTTVFLALALAAGAQQVVYDLRQDWVYYDSEAKGFLPVEEQNFNNRVISFNLSDTDYDNFYLTIGVNHKAYLFYRTKLLATIYKGITSYRIDSLKRIINDDTPFLSIYGNNLLPELSTQVSVKPLKDTMVEAFKPRLYANDFSNFFYLATTLITIFFVLLKVRFPELMDQYLLVQRTFRVKTIDEYIYKVPFLGFPNNLFIIFFSLVLSLLLLSFMYFYPGELSFLNINPEASDFSVLMISWLQIFVILLGLMVFKYFITLLFSAVFALKIGDIHYASTLRFLMAFVLVFMIATFLQVVLLGIIPETIFWISFVLALIIIETILFFKLTLVSSHTLLYIIVYLCATEIIPIIFLYELVTI